MNKKAFFFTIDAFIAFGVLIAGFLLVLATHTFQPIESQTIFFSKDLLEVFSSTKIDQVDNQLIFQMRCTNCECGTYCGLIKNIDNTLLEQMGEFVYRANEKNCKNCMGAAREIALTVSASLINPQFSYEFVIKETKAGKELEYTMLNRTLKPQDRTDLLIVSKRLIYGIADNRDMFGPYIAEVRVWQ